MKLLVFDFILVKRTGVLLFTLRSMLESGYGYGIKFAFHDGGAGAWNEYPDVFKFRVEE